MFDNFHCLFNDQEGIKCNAFIYDRSQYFHYFVLKNSSRNQSLYCLYMCLMGTLGHRYLSPFFNLKINIWHPKFKWYGIQLWMEAHSFNTWSIKKKWYKIWHEYTLYKFYKKVKKKWKIIWGFEQSTCRSRLRFTKEFTTYIKIHQCS